MYEPLVCPECGSAEFYQDRPEVNRYRVQATAASYGAYVERTDDLPECLDSERDEPIYCDGCGWELDEDELVTEDELSKQVETYP